MIPRAGSGGMTSSRLRLFTRFTGPSAGSPGRFGRSPGAFGEAPAAFGLPFVRFGDTPGGFGRPPVRFGRPSGRFERPPVRFGRPPGRFGIPGPSGSMAEPRKPGRAKDKGRSSRNSRGSSARFQFPSSKEQPCLERAGRGSSAGAFSCRGPRVLPWALLRSPFGAKRCEQQPVFARLRRGRPIFARPSQGKPVIARRRRSTVLLAVPHRSRLIAPSSPLASPRSMLPARTRGGGWGFSRRIGRGRRRLGLRRRLGRLAGGGIRSLDRFDRRCRARPWRRISRLRFPGRIAGPG